MTTAERIAELAQELYFTDFPLEKDTPEKRAEEWGKYNKSGKPDAAARRYIAMAERAKAFLSSTDAGQADAKEDEADELDRTCGRPTGAIFQKTGDPTYNKLIDLHLNLLSQHRHLLIALQETLDLVRDEARNAALDSAIAAIALKQSPNPVRHSHGEAIHEDALSYAIETIHSLKTPSKGEAGL
jgi:hypothetical protein